MRFSDEYTDICFVGCGDSGGGASCSGPISRYDVVIFRAERLMPSNVDSAMALIDAIDHYRGTCAGNAERSRF